jgi:formyl-CoA transferase
MLCCLKPDRDWPQICRALEVPHLACDPRFTTVAGRKEHTRELVRLLDEQFATKDLEEWRTIFRDNQLVFSPVPTTCDVIEDEQMALNEVFIRYDAPELNGMPVVNSPIFVADSPKRAPQPPPELGQHTREILESLSYDEATIARLANEEIVQLETSE